MKVQNSILKSAEKRFESSLFDIQDVLQADLFDSELDTARALAKNGFDQNGVLMAYKNAIDADSQKRCSFVATLLAAAQLNVRASQATASSKEMAIDGKAFRIFLSAVTSCRLRRLARATNSQS
jgi:hypothetical protein